MGSGALSEYMIFPPVTQGGAQSLIYANPSSVDWGGI